MYTAQVHVTYESYLIRILFNLKEDATCIILASSQENLSLGFANYKGADQPANQR